MLDIKTFKIGDKVIVIDNMTVKFLLRLNNKYTINNIAYNKTLKQYFVKLLEIGDISFFIYRFNSDLKTIRKKKLEKIIKYESI